MHSKIDLNLHRVLLNIYQHKSISAAADALFLSQPAVSHALARLREHHQDPLFVRQGRKMVATKHCQLVIGKVEQGLTLLSESLLDTHEFDISSQQKTIYLGLRDIVEAMLFPALMANLASIAPNIRINSRPSQQGEISRELRDGKVDIVVDTLYPVDKDIKTLQVINDQFVLVCRQKHCITAQNDITEYLRHKHVVASLRDRDINIVDRALTQTKHIRDISLRCDNFYAAIKVIQQSDLLLTVPSAIANQFAQDFAIEILPLPFAVPALPVHIYWHASKDEDQVVAWMRQQINSIF